MLSIKIYFKSAITFIFFIICYVNCVVSFADKTQSLQDISSILKPIVTQYKIPGMVASIVSSKAIQAVGAAGVRRRSFPEKVTIHDLFHIGSDTKSMTATLLAVLVEKGLLDWKTKVISVFPKLQEKINPAYKALTLQQLLTMRGGLVKDIDYDKVQKAANGNLVKARQIGMVQALSQPPEAPPGTFHYSNMSYIIAGHMAEKVMQRSWEQLMQNFLFSPLHMYSAGFGPPAASGSHDQPVGHEETGKPVVINVYADNLEILGPAGTVHLSIFDWSKYIMLHLQATEGQPHLLKAGFFKKLHTPVSSPAMFNPTRFYAMGWFIINLNWAKGNVLLHPGTNELWYSKVWIAPKQDLAILVACNQGGKNAIAATKAAGLALMQHALQLENMHDIDSNLSSNNQKLK